MDLSDPQTKTLVSSSSLPLLLLARSSPLPRSYSLPSSLPSYSSPNCKHDVSPSFQFFNCPVPSVEPGDLGPIFNLYSSDEESAGDVSNKIKIDQVWETMDSNEEETDGYFLNKFNSFKLSSDRNPVREYDEAYLDSDEEISTEGETAGYRPKFPLVGVLADLDSSDEETIAEEITIDGSNEVNDSAPPSSDSDNLAGMGAHISKMKHMLGLILKPFYYFRGKSKEQDNVLPRLRTSMDEDSLLDGDNNIDDECGMDGKADEFIHSLLMKQMQESNITYQDQKEHSMDYCTPSTSTAQIQYKTSSLYTSKTNGFLHTVYIYCLDTLQYSFPSHLSTDFRRKGIYAPVNYNGTLDEIEGPSAFVVVFSENYLSSISFLDKLVRIFQWRRRTGQLVVPVFYGISPSDVVVQEHDESADRIKEWSSALLELRELPGHRSREECSECELVEEIVKDVHEKLFPTEQIGINSRLLKIEQLLCKQPWGIRRIGIWGMPGIGKTTLAKAVFDLMSGGYEASCFINHFDKAFHEKGRHRLLVEHFRDVLKELPRECSSITRPSLTGNNLNKKRTLVVLDDVHNPLVAESFLGGFHWFGPGSLIIITSRDRQVFQHCRINHVYEVCSLDENEALQLFSQCAYVKNISEENLLKLSNEVIDYANGNPLALSYYGKELKGKKLSEMESTFLKLKLRTPYKIYDLFKSSYETLNDIEKNIFLDIACFFNGENVEYVMQLLEGCGFFPHVGINVLVEKCLVTIFENKVKMHSIIQDFGREIINGETIKIERRRRLWEPWTIKYLLEDDNPGENEDPKVTYKRAMGSEDIESISLDTSNLSFDVKPTAFEDMLSLRFLKIYSSDCENDYGLRLSKGLESLPNELRLLHWDDYPLQSLPQDFDPSHLVELDMSFTQLQKLWGGTKNFDKLKTVRLCHSEQLAEIDDVSRAQTIELIDLQGCTKLQSFPATGQLQHLRVVNLSGCREINSFPEISPNIEELYLQGTGIRELAISSGTATNLEVLDVSFCLNLVELHASFGNAINLKKLCFHGCSSLVELPASIGSAVNLEVLDLSSCSSLMQLPSSLGNFKNLKELYLSGCSSLVKLLFSFENVINLKKLYFHGCSSLMELPACIGKATGLEILDLSKCSRLVELPSSFGELINLKKLYLNRCSSLVKLPLSFGNASNLKKLYFHGCSSLVELPPSIGNATKLEILDLSYCSSLLELPSSFGNFINLKELCVNGCSSLVKLPLSFGNLISLKILLLHGCSNLVELPASFGNAPKLEILDLGNCSSLYKLPSSFGNFINLKELYLNGCSSLAKLPFSLGNVINLEILDLSNCSSFVEFPYLSGQAVNLKELYLNGCSSLVNLPSWLGKATHLKKLYLRGCSSLVELPASIRNVTNLEVMDLSNCSSLVVLTTSTRNATDLQKVNLEYCSMDLTRGSSLPEFPASTSNATNLDMLDPSNYSSLVRLPVSFTNAINLKELYLHGYSSLVELPASIGNAINLEIMDLTDCSSLVELPSSFENFINLKELYLTGCSRLVKLPLSFGNAIELKKLDLTGCLSLVELPASFENAINLKELYLCGCSRLVELPAYLGNAPNLEILDLGNCTSLVGLPSSFGNAINLKELYLTGCSSLVELPSSFGNAANLKILYLTRCSSLVKLPASIGNATNLRVLDLAYCSSLVELPSSIMNVVNLQELNLEYCSSLVKLPSSFGNATNLKKLCLTGCEKLVDFPSSSRKSTSLMSIDVNGDNNQPTVTVIDKSGSRCIEVRRAKGGKIFVLNGIRNSEHSVSLSLSVEDENGHVRHNRFLFQKGDTAYKVSTEVVKQLKLTDQNVMLIAELVNILLVNMIPTRKPKVTEGLTIHSQLNQNSQSHQTEAKTQRQEETTFHDACKLVSHPQTSNFPRSDKGVKQYADYSKVESGRSSQEAIKQVSSKEEERLKQELDEIEAKYQEEMKEIARKREEAMIETKKKLSLMRERTS